MSQPQMPIGPVLIEEVERTNIVIVHPQHRVGLVQHNLYAMDIDRSENRNYYNYRRFGYLARNCRNRRIRNRIEKGKRLEYRQKLIMKEEQENLNKKEDLVVLD